MPTTLSNPHPSNWRVIHDLRYALRLLVRAPGFALVAVLTLALGVGANTAVFSVVRAVLLAPLPFTDPGFSISQRQTLRVTLPVARYPLETPRRAAFYARLFEQLSGLPGVTAAGGVSELPLGDLRNMGTFEIQGRPTPRGQDKPHGDWRSASPGYFRAMGIPLVRGRIFTDRDGAGAPPVAIVDEEAARRFWPAGDPIGSRITVDDASREIVSVVGTVHHDALDQPPRGSLYFPLAQRPTATIFAVVNTADDPAGVVASARATIRGLDPDLPVYDVRTLEDRLTDSLGRRSLAMWLLVAFGGLALALAAIGVYGVLAYDVSQRRHEIGIRMALGADRSRVLRMVLASAVALTVVGIGIGLAIAAAAARAASGLLYGVSPYDPITYAVFAAVLMGTAIAAAYLPARRATTVDPMTALRDS